MKYYQRRRNGGNVTQFGEGVGKFITGFGHAGDKILGFSATNGLNNLVEGTLKLYEEVTNKIIVEGNSNQFSKPIKP